MLNLAPPVILLLLTAILAIALLQGVVTRMDAAHHQAQVTAGALQGEMKTFRTVVLALAAVFVVVINVSAELLVRTAAKILRPVDALVEATRQLSRENFQHRVTLRERNEFDELAAAYNNLAAHLQETEQRRVDVLAQVGIALNHELNNALATIEMQLKLVSRRNALDPQTEGRLHTIHQSLARMKDAIASLRNVRRIVLTDYGPGQKMLDLVRSAEPPIVPQEALHA
jgi:signal transduction histidine kinase